MKFETPLIINESPAPLEGKQSKYKTLRHERLNWVYLRCRLAEAQNWKCCYCGCEMRVDTSSNRGKSVTIDHVDPYSKSKNNDPSNLVAACAHCNSDRGDMCAYEFFKSGNKRRPTLNVRARRQIGRFRGYANRMRKFKEKGFPANDYIKNMDDWIETLRVNDTYKSALRQLDEQWVQTS